MVSYFSKNIIEVTGPAAVGTYIIRSTIITNADGQWTLVIDHRYTCVVCTLNYYSESSTYLTLL